VNVVAFVRSVVLATVVVTVFCGQAAATPRPPRLLGLSTAGVASDGGRFVAFMS
jgi:hypothetical protein